MEHGLGVAGPVEVDGFDAQLYFGSGRRLQRRAQGGQRGVGQRLALLGAAAGEQGDTDMGEGAGGCRCADREAIEGNCAALDVGFLEQPGCGQRGIEGSERSTWGGQIEVTGVFKRQVGHRVLLRRAVSA